MKRKQAGPTLDELVARATAEAGRGDLPAAVKTYEQVLAREPANVGVRVLLATVKVDLGEADAAIDLLEPARAAMPDFPPILVALGSAYAVAGHDDLAVASMEAAIKHDPSSTLPMERLAKHHIRANRRREAIGLLRRILRRDPAHPNAPFLLGALTGEQTNVPAPPPDLVADLFDTYAISFDEHLINKLGYTVPTQLVWLLPAPPDGSFTVVDLGCGTGLSGVALRPYARRLIGVDLSPRMLRRALERQLYDELRCEDLLATLARVHDADLIVAADVFIYVGALEATFAACATALRPGGRLAFSVERTDAPTFVLQPTLRYAHSRAYIDQLAAAHSFTVERAESSVLRIDHETPIDGDLFVLRR